jgi:hypothetical protein
VTFETPHLSLYAIDTEPVGGGGGGGGGGTPTTPTDDADDDKDSTDGSDGTTGTTPTQPASDFNDVSSGAWYAQAVNYVVSNNLFLGVSASEFAPNQTMNRAMLVTVLARLEFGSDDKIPAGGSVFSDLSQDWYKNAVAWGSVNGIINGLSTELFGPTSNVTREQIAVFFYRYAQMKGYDTTVDESALDSFADSNSISDYAKEAMLWAVSKGIITGTDTGLDPLSESTRAQVATIVMRFAEQYK